MIYIISLSISVFLWVLFLLLHKFVECKTGRLITLWLRIPLVVLHFSFLCIFYSIVKKSVDVVSWNLACDWSNRSPILYGVFCAFFYSIFFYPAFKILMIYCKMKTSKPSIGAIRHWIGISFLLSFCPIFCFIESASSYRSSDQKDYFIFGILGVTFLLLPWLIYWLTRKQLGKRRQVISKRSEKSFFNVFIPVFLEKFSAFQKISLYMSVASVLMLSIAWLEWDAAFYTMLRWVVCLAFAGHLFGNFSSGLKFALIIGAIMYNPLAPVQLGDRGLWFLLNLLSLLLIVACQVLIIQEIRKKLKETEDNGTPEKR